MFVAAEFQSMRSRCPAELEDLLKSLSIPLPDWSGNEYRIYERIDSELEKKICALMKSPSIIEGYTTLLKLGGVPYDFSETDNELLNKIISNGQKILSAIHASNQEHDLWQTEWGNAKPAPERSEVISVEAFDVKPFDKDRLTSKFDKIRASYNPYLPTAREAVGRCIDEVENLRGVFELKSEIPFEDVSELLRKVSMPLHDDKERVICLRVKKKIQFSEKQIPPAPLKPAFTVSQAEDVLKVLLKINEIIKKI